MKIFYYYGSTVLGFVEKTENGFMYTSNIPNEQKLRSERLITESDYKLFDSFERESEELFSEFKQLIPGNDPDEYDPTTYWQNPYNRRVRPDTIDRAKINFGDSEWEMLTKMSKLNWFPSGFYVQDKLNEVRQESSRSQASDDNTW